MKVGEETTGRAGPMNGPYPQQLTRPSR
jgi:hypothetical protein